MEQQDLYKEAWKAVRKGIERDIREMKIAISVLSPFQLIKKIQYKSLITGLERTLEYMDKVEPVLNE